MLSCIISAYFGIIDPTFVDMSDFGIINPTFVDMREGVLTLARLPQNFRKQAQKENRERFPLWKGRELVESSICSWSHRKL